MRRLFLILLAWLAFVPPMPAQAHRHAASCAACPVQRGHDGGCADHGCLGCSIRAEPAAALAPRLDPLPMTRVALAPGAPTQHRPGFDPPPPRARG
jgi:hypothetical protein